MRFERSLARAENGAQEAFGLDLTGPAVAANDLNFAVAR
jgi:hypothetical protein